MINMQQKRTQLLHLLLGLIQKVVPWLSNGTNDLSMVDCPPKMILALEDRQHLETMMSWWKFAIMSIYCFSIEGIVRHKFVPQKQTDNQMFYKDVLTRLRERILKNRPEKWRSELGIFDIPLRHSVLSTQEFLANKKYLWSGTLSILLIWSPVFIFLFPGL